MSDAAVKINFSQGTPERVYASSIYSLRDIAQLRVIPTFASESSTIYRLQRHVRLGWLKAQNIGTEARPIYAVRGSDLITYLKERYDLSLDEQ